MHIYFGKVSPRDLGFMDLSDLFVTDSGDAYFYRITYFGSGGDFYIEDSIGRSVPIPVDMLKMFNSACSVLNITAALELSGEFTYSDDLTSETVNVAIPNE